MIQFNIIVTSIALLWFGVLLFLAGQRLRSGRAPIPYLMIYVGLGFLSNLSWILIWLKLTPIPENNLRLLADFTFLAMILSFGGLTLNFLHQSKKQVVNYWLGTVFILAIWATLAIDFQGWNSLRLIPNLENKLLLAGLAWIVSIATVGIALATEFKKNHTAQQLNRLRYWLIALVMWGISGLLLFINPVVFDLIGWLPILVASTLVSYVILNHHTRDLNLSVGHILYYSCVTGTVTVIFYLSIAATIVISRTNLNTVIVFLWSVALAVLLATFTPPLFRFLNKVFTRIIFGRPYRDEKQIIKVYNQRISDALDLRRLADTLVELMTETLDIKRGIVFVNQRGSRDKITLSPVSYIGVAETSTGDFNTYSPFIDYFRKDRKSLYQYDVMTLPEFNDMNSAEKKWLSNLSMELYVPVMRQKELVGLLAFGPKSKWVTYSSQDIDLMVTLADQAALAMDSSRLFEQLTTINQEVGSLSEQLEGLDKNKADFLSIASHELRTPLTHIHGYTRILADFSDEELSNTAQIRTIIQGIIKGTERMKNVVDIMFDVSEVNIGEMTLFSGPVNLSNVVDQASRPFLTALDERRIAFGKNGFEDAPIIEGDGTRLVQAFENLIGNAVKYTPDGGLITVNCRSIVTDEFGQAVEFSVVDNGIGIDPEYHERIFEKFFRIDDTDHHSTGSTKFKGAGPGLGLTLVKGIVEAHGGKVWVESLGHDEVNCPGSKFYFVIPLHPISTPTNQVPEKQSMIETVQWRNKDMK